MRTRQFDAATIRDLLKAQKIAVLDNMKTALGTQAPATVFRKLSELKHHTSYSHAARYYTLAKTAGFYATQFKELLYGTLGRNSRTTPTQCGRRFL